MIDIQHAIVGAHFQEAKVFMNTMEQHTLFKFLKK